MDWQPPTSVTTPRRLYGKNRWVRLQLADQDDDGSDRSTNQDSDDSAYLRQEPSGYANHDNGAELPNSGGAYFHGQILRLFSSTSWICDRYDYLGIWWETLDVSSSSTAAHPAQCLHLTSQREPRSL